MIHYSDIKLPDNSYDCGLTLLVGKKIKEIRGMFSPEFDEAVWQINSIEFEDGTIVNVEGEHDIAYIPYGSRDPLPNMDDDTMNRLFDEQEGDDGEEEEDD